MPQYLVFAFCFLAPMGLLAQPRIRFSSPPIPGIEVITARADFERELSNLPMVAAAVKQSPMMRYCYLLRNKSSRHIVVYSTRWTRTSGDGRIATVDAIWWNLDAKRGGDDIQPGETRLVTPLYRFGLSSPIGTLPDSEKLQLFLSQYDTATEVTVSLEAVVFDTGDAYGPDRNGALAQAQATLDARRDLAKEFISRAREKIDPTALATWMNGLVNGPRDSSGDATSYAYTYDLTQRSLARFFRERLRSGAMPEGIAADLDNYLQAQTLAKLRLRSGPESNC